MRSSIKALIAATAIGSASVAAVSPAEARYHGGGNGAAVAAGIIGLGVGAAIASSANHHRYYNEGYYDAGYAPAPYYGGYAPPVVVYDRGYYGGGYDYYGGGRGYYGHGGWNHRGHDWRR